MTSFFFSSLLISLEDAYLLVYEIDSVDSDLEKLEEEIDVVTKELEAGYLDRIEFLKRRVFVSRRGKRRL